MPGRRQVDDAPGAGREVRRVEQAAKGVPGRARRGGGGVVMEQAGERRAAEAQREPPQEIPAVQGKLDWRSHAHSVEAARRTRVGLLSASCRAES